MHLNEAGYHFDPPEPDRSNEPSRLDPSGQVRVALYTTDPEGWLTYYNEAAAVLWGRRPVLGQERWCGSWRMYEPDGTPMPHDRCGMVIALREGRALRDVQGIIERQDGTRVAVIAHPTPLHDASGALVGGSNLLLPIQPPQPRKLFRNEPQQLGTIEPN